MGAKRFDCLHDFSRWGQNIHLTCRNGHCDHFGIVDPWQAGRYFLMHRWPTALEGFMGSSALNRFRCSRCGARAGQASPTSNPPTVTQFFPADEAGWRMLQRRLRG